MLCKILDDEQETEKDEGHIERVRAYDELRYRDIMWVKKCLERGEVKRIKYERRARFVVMWSIWMLKDTGGHGRKPENKSIAGNFSCLGVVKRDGKFAIQNKLYEMGGCNAIP